MHHRITTVMKFQTYFLLLLLSLITFVSYSQRKNRPINAPTTALSDSTFIGLKLRNIGPAFMSGRIADVAIHPEDDNIWYVAVGSGGVWKTVNAGTTWTPVFDQQPTYSIGCVTIDPSNPHIVWVGTGENIGGRHVGYGDGIYRSEDGGTTWKNMGLKTSEHISKIIIHPDNSQIIMVASQGPLWKSGGERGFYKSIDGGQSWKRTLGDSQWVGVTDIVVDPRNPNWLYAATWQRHRTVAAYMGGGPGSGIYRSEDGGENWKKLSQGLPKSHLGKIGLAISPQKSDVIYAAIELDRKKGGVFKSMDKGSSWTKQSDAVSGATGPHYYQELYASPHKYDRLYLMDAWMQTSEDGGKTFTRVNREHKHGDNHAIAFRKDDPDYLLVGTDGGLYESFDLAANWRFMENLPITQYYKVALDDSEPFYNIYGGTQDNSTQGGPSRTDNVHGIQNSDWRIVLNWDGHQPATEPGNPDIMYAERQQGNLSRVDLTTGEVVDIQPQPADGDPHERYNWDAPILVSPHAPNHIYFASYRVWESEDRGDHWTAISGDLTRNQDRFALPIMGKLQSWDAPWDVAAMSNYNTITSLAESPLQAGLLYAGTDDGIIQVTEDGGQNWRKIELGSISGIPATAFVNDVRADLHDANTVYAALDNHKYGDFRPYIIKSIDRGRSWTSISGNLPNGTLIWRLVQDHVKPELMFAATEYGIYFSINAGTSWTMLKGGVPTISFRDISIQRREHDLVGASFGRGFFILDDYSALREVTPAQLAEPATLFPVRKAWWYVPRPQLSFDNMKGSQGASHYVAPNPAFGATFTYYLSQELQTSKAQRQKREKELHKRNTNIPFPGWASLEAERREEEPKIWFTVKDQSGQIVRRLSGPAKKGMNRVAWDLRYPAPDAIDLESIPAPNSEPQQGLLAAPGTYMVSMSQQVNGVTTALSSSQSFEVVPLRKGALATADIDAAVTFYRDYEATFRANSALQLTLKNALTKIKGMQQALNKSTADPLDLDQRLHVIKEALYDLDMQYSGSKSKQEPGEKVDPTIGERLFAINRGITRSTYGPTSNHKQGLALIKSQLKTVSAKLSTIQQDMATLSRDLTTAGAPWVEGDALPVIE